MTYDPDYFKFLPESSKQAIRSYRERIHGNSYFALQLANLKLRHFLSDPEQEKQRAGLIEAIDSYIEPVRVVLAAVINGCPQHKGTRWPEEPCAAQCVEVWKAWQLINTGVKAPKDYKEDYNG